MANGSCLFLVVVDRLSSESRHTVFRQNTGKQCAAVICQFSDSNAKRRAQYVCGYRTVSVLLERL